MIYNIIFICHFSRVLFPNNMGVTISGVSVPGKGTVDKGIFLNEERMFGICKEKDDNTESSS